MDLRERPSSSTTRHPWETSRMQFFRRVLEGLEEHPSRWLDAGAGDAWLAHQLKSSLPGVALTCWDAYYRDEDLEQLPKQHESTTFVRQAPEGPFDLITALDVLEHVEDDAAYLETLRQSLRPGGIFLMSVPAWPSLFTDHDTRLAHFRRYRPDVAEALLRGGGFDIVEGGGLFHSLLPVRALGKTLEVLRKGAETLGIKEPAEEKADLGWTAPEGVTNAIVGALNLDHSLARRLGKTPVALPGLSYWALCRRR